MKPRPIHWIAAILGAIALGRLGAIEYEDQQVAEAHRQETIKAAQAEAKARKKEEAQALARHLYEQHLLDQANTLMHPLGQAWIASINRR